ncbi:hypothetical protein LZ009_08580 [Ramlibacter sp. XY19]|uniref:hypothetical protein n=1 Tax=Ramlibacter paludis TaxID=2908000 RepID=UPI0023D9DBF0|nr:hypothetical protein [Ramlibacter paludis]MCG2592834.1 hypothetical protein [Ramlibacter paludis]
MTNILRRAVVALTVVLLAACGGGGDPDPVASAPPPADVPPEVPAYVAPPTVETFPVAAVMRQLAKGYTFTAFAPDPDTGFPSSLSTVTYAPTGPGAFERRQAFVKGEDRSDFVVNAGFTDAGPNGGLRFNAFRSATDPKSKFTVENDLPETATPEAAGPDADILFAPAGHSLFNSLPLFLSGQFSPNEHWDYSWRLYRRSPTRAELCLNLRRITGDFFFFLYANTDCFEIDGTGEIQRTRIVTKRGCCRLPVITTSYE